MVWGAFFLLNIIGICFEDHNICLLSQYYIDKTSTSNSEDLLLLVELVLPKLPKILNSKVGCNSFISGREMGQTIFVTKRQSRLARVTAIQTRGFSHIDAQDNVDLSTLRSLRQKMLL